MSDHDARAAATEWIPGGEARLLLCTAPPARAQLLARALVEARLAACVNLIPGVRSIYRWQGAIADDPETLLLIKTTAGRLEALAAYLGEQHPYDVPELLAFPPEGGLAPYLAWLAAQTEPPKADD